MLSSCIVPETNPNKNYDCQLVTNECSLEVKGLDNGATRSCLDAECVLAIIAIVTAGVITVSAGSLIVSGSVVVVGNTVHWLEQQGFCDDSITQKTVDGFVSRLKGAGGYLISTSKDMSDWLTSPLSDD